MHGQKNNRRGSVWQRYKVSNIMKEEDKGTILSTQSLEEKKQIATEYGKLNREVKAKI